MALEKLQCWKCWCKERQWSHWDWHGSNMDDVVWHNIIHILLQCREWQKHVKTVIWSLVIKNGKANICTAPQLNSLPPASEVIVQHVYHAHYQTMIWKFTLEIASPAADPINYGWPEEEGRLLPCNAATECCTGTRWGVADDKMWLCVNTSLLDCKM